MLCCAGGDPAVSRVRGEGLIFFFSGRVGVCVKYALRRRLVTHCKLGTVHCYRPYLNGGSVCVFSVAICSVCRVGLPVI